jgi:transposase
MKRQELRSARARFIEARAQGHSWQQAVAIAGLPVRRAAAYALEQRVRLHGEAALDEGRHGHPAKLRAEVRSWLESTCAAHPEYPAAVLQQRLLDQFNLSVSQSQINRLRKALALPYRHPKKS